MSDATGVRTKGALAALGFAALAACGAGGATGTAPPLPPPPAPTVAEPGLGVPAAPAGPVAPSACTFGDRVPLGAAPVLSVLYDRGADRVLVATAPTPGRVAFAALEASDGSLRPHTEVTLPAGGEAEGAFRNASGELVVVYRAQEQWRFAKVVGGVPLEQTSVLRYATTMVTAAGLEARESWAGPLDDPSEARHVGVLLGATDAQGITSGTLCISDALAFRAERCHYGWSGGAAPTRTAHTGGNGSTYLAHGQGYAQGSPLALGISSAPYLWAPLGLAQAAAPTNPYGRRRTAMQRMAHGDMTRGGPLLASATATVVALWAEAQGALVAQLLDAFAQPVLDPLPMPFADGRLIDTAATPTEVLVTLTARADRSASPRTTTLVRLAPTLPPNAPAVAPPQRAPLADARLVPLQPGTVLLWSREDRAALVARCPSAR